MSSDPGDKILNSSWLLLLVICIVFSDMFLSVSVSLDVNRSPDPCPIYSTLLLNKGQNHQCAGESNNI